MLDAYKYERHDVRAVTCSGAAGATVMWYLERASDLIHCWLVVDPNRDKNGMLQPWTDSAVICGNSDAPCW